MTSANLSLQLYNWDGRVSEPVHHGARKCSAQVVFVQLDYSHGLAVSVCKCAIQLKVN